MRTRLPHRTARAWALSVFTVVLAGAALVLVSGAPPPAEATDVPPARTALATPPPPAPPAAAAAGPARVELDGPLVDGMFGLTSRAVLAGDARELLAELRLEGLRDEGARDERVPVAIAVVLDHSGSMSGDKMVAAREAVVSLLERMHDEDQLAVVVYDDTADVLQPLAPVAALRRTLPPRVRAVQADGGTNIPAGMDLGALALAAAPPGLVRRVVLVSDGQDGSGVPLEAIEGAVSRRASERATTSALGVGLDFDERFMTHVADAGRGNYAFLQRGEELTAFLTRELEEGAASVVEDVVAELELPTGVRFVAAHGTPATASGSRVRLELGRIFAGERRKVVFELSASSPSPGAALPIPVRLSYRTIRDGAPHTAAGTTTVSVVATEAEVVASRDLELHPDALTTVLDARQDDAVARWRAGDPAAAVRVTDASLARYRAEAAAAPSPVLDARIAELEEERTHYGTESAASEAGRAFGLGRGARSATRADAY